MNTIAFLVVLSTAVATVVSHADCQKRHVASVTHGTAIVTSHLPGLILIGADSGGRRRLQDSHDEEIKSVCKIAAVGSRFLLSFSTMDIQNDVSDPNDHLLKRASTIVKEAFPSEPVESILWKIAQSEAKVMVMWNEQDPDFFAAQVPEERGPAITLAHMDEEGHSEVLIAELKMEEEAAGSFLPAFTIRVVQPGETAFGAKAAAVRKELLAKETKRARAKSGSLAALDQAYTPRKLRKAIRNFISIAKAWYPRDVFGVTDLAALTLSGVDLSRVKSYCR